MIEELKKLMDVLQAELDASTKLVRERFLPEMSLEFHSGKQQSLTLALSHLILILASAPDLDAVAEKIWQSVFVAVDSEIEPEFEELLPDNFNPVPIIAASLRTQFEPDGGLGKVEKITESNMADASYRKVKEM